MAKPISLGLTSHPGRAKAAGSARLLNCYAEIAGTEQKAQEQVWACDGLVLFVEVGAGPIRGLLEVDGLLYVVSGRGIYTVTQAGAVTQLGGISGDGQVYMARNRRDIPQIGIWSSDGGYVIVEGSAVTPVYDTDLIPPTSGVFSDGYFVMSHANGRISHTESDNGLLIDGLAFATAESSPDRTVRVMALQNYVIVLGERSTEWWVDVGGDPFAFQRDHSETVGCAAAGSCVNIAQTIAFVADDRTVRILEGHSATKISNLAVDRAIGDEADVSALTATTWRADGHVFYALSGADWTYVYDLTTQQWHNRASKGSNRWRVSCVAEFDGMRIAGDRTSGRLYRMQRDAYDENGDPMLVEIITPPVHAWPSNLQVAALHLDMVTGVGEPHYVSEATINRLTWDDHKLTWGGRVLTWGKSADYNPHSIDPQVMMSCSFDGGHWGTERTVSLGQLGAYQRKLTWRRIGSTRGNGVTFRFRASAAVMRGFLGCAIEAAQLAA